jgi:hypothetical protein
MLYIRVGESVGEGPECNFSATSAENVGICWKMSQDLKKIQKHSFFFKLASFLVRKTVSE